MTVESKVYATIRRAGLAIDPVKLTLIVRDAQWAKRTGGAAGLKNYLRNLIAHGNNLYSN